MKLARIALALALLAVSAFSLLASAKPLEELMRLAGQDALPEVRQAAGHALTPALIASTMSNDALRQLAQSGASAELRSAAAWALGARLIQTANNLDQLEALAASGGFLEVRMVASQALSQRLLQSDIALDALAQIAIAGASPELRRASIPALIRAFAGSERSLADLLDAAGSGATTEYRLAAAQALVLRLEDSPLVTLDQQMLLAISGGQTIALLEEAKGANAQIRAAAAAVFEDRLRQTSSSLSALESLAGDPSKTPELRAAAGVVLSEQLLQANLSLADLENIATGTTPELRTAAHQALVQALVAAVGRRSMSLDLLIGSVAKAPSEELAEAETEAVFVLLRSALVAPEAQPDVEALANGKSVRVAGFTLDGSLQAFRVAAGDFLSGIYTFFGFLDRLSDPLKQLSAIAGNATLSPEFRAAAGRALASVYLAQRGRATQDLATLDELLNQISQAAAQGQSAQALDALAHFKQLLNSERSLLIVTAEVGGQLTASELLNDDVNRRVNRIEGALKSGEPLTINAELSAIQTDFRTLANGIARAPDLSNAELEHIAASGTTTELRQAASQTLTQRLLHDSPGQSALEQLAREGASAELRQAAVPALAADYVSARLDPDQLYHWALNGETDEWRLAAAQAFMHSPLGTNLQLSQLKALANGEAIEISHIIIDGSKTELRQVFADLLQNTFLVNNQTNEDLATWAVQGATPELRQAAAEAWAERMANSGKPTLDQLIEFAISGSSTELRQGAAEALSRRLIASSLTENDLFALASMHTRAFGSIAGTSAELSQALAQALADRFAHES